MAVATQAQVEYVSGIRFEDVADPAIAYFLDAAQAAAERYLGCPIVQADYTEVHDGQPIIVLDRYPIVLDPGPVITAHPPGGGVSVVTDLVRISEDGIIEGVTGRVQVEYTAGYDPVPPDLTAAVAKLAGSIYVASQGAGGASAGVTSKSIGDFSVSYADPAAMAEVAGGGLLVGSLFGRFRRWVVR